LQRAFDVSERRACRVVEQPRSTHRYEAKRADDEASLVTQMHELVRRHPRFGYRRIGALLRKDGWAVNLKRIWRLWKREGFKVPGKQRKKRRLGCTENGVMRRRAEHKDHVWAWDFIHDRDEFGRPLKWLVIQDEFTRESLALEVERRMRAVDVMDVLSQVILIRGAPQFIRSDNGPEFIAKAMRDFLATTNIGTLYIEPGSPWENGYAESFNSRLRDELLNTEVFSNLQEAKWLAARWRNEYNHRRPHSSLGYRTPAAFAAQAQGQAEARSRYAGSTPLRLAPLASAPCPRHTMEKTRPTLIATGT